MTQPSTINIERLTDQIHKITLSNPHANLIAQRPSLDGMTPSRR
jgi:hypothetical protein